MGALVVAPLPLVWSRWPHRPWPRDRAWEGLALLGGLTLASWLVFGMRVAPAQAPLHCVVFPFVIVAALRFGQRGTTTVTAVASAIPIWGTAVRTGPFGGHDIGQGLVLVPAVDLGKLVEHCVAVL